MDIPDDNNTAAPAPVIAAGTRAGDADPDMTDAANITPATASESRNRARRESFDSPMEEYLPKRQQISHSQSATPLEQDNGQTRIERLEATNADLRTQVAQAEERATLYRGVAQCLYAHLVEHESPLANRHRILDDQGGVDRSGMLLSEVDSLKEMREQVGHGLDKLEVEMKERGLDNEWKELTEEEQVEQ